MPKKDKELENQPEGTGMSRRDFAKLAAVSTATALGSSVSMPKKTLAKPGKELAGGAEEIYQCKDLKRFSMRNDTFILLSQEKKGFWFNEYMRNKFENLKNSKIGKSVPVKDAKEARAHMALMLGANFWNTVSNPYGNCFENMGMLSWKPLTVPPILQGNPDPDPDPEDLAKKVKQMGRVLGANEIGIAKLNRKWVYDETVRLNPLFIMDGGDPALMPGMPSMSGKGGMGLSPDQMKRFLGGPGGEPVKYIPKKIVFKDVKEPGENDTELIIPDSVRYAVVVLVDMNRLATQMGPSSSATDVATNMGYSRMALTEIALAEAIRAMGYNAIPSKNSVALSVPLAVDAGLGQVGRHGILINPEYGPALRLGKVLTDMPLVPDKPIDFGVTDFCSECNKCAEHCPSSAISFRERSYEPPGPSGNPGALKWYVNGLKCLGYWVDSGGYCTACQAVCPYTKGDFWGHGFIRGVSRSVPALDPFWTFMDDVFGYGKMRDPALMWDMKMSPFGIDTTKEV